MEWQEIDTAPTNDRSDYFSCYVAWGPDDDQSTGDAMRYKGKWFAAGQFYVGGEHDQRQYKFKELEISPTHWMPTPEVPKAS